MLRRQSLVLCLACLASAAERIDTEVNERIRQEANSNSKILSIVHRLTDVYGPRLTGSPQLRLAGEWAARQLAEWGLAGARLEPFGFGRDGWTNERVSAFLTEPVRQTLIGAPLAWTPGTAGQVTAACYHLVLPDGITQEELAGWLAGRRDEVRGRIVLVGRPGPVVPFSDQIDLFLKDAGALVRVNDAARPLGQVRVLQSRFGDVSRVVPTLVLRSEDFGRAARLMEDGLPVEMAVEIASSVHPDGRTAYNVVAEIPGTDKRDEVVMLGAHLDSWHAATGATDNAAGVAVMMEAVRILKAIRAEPRRTIRVALWAGEEQGLLGSQAYVRQHFGTAEVPRAGFDRLSAYLNLDEGTGRVVGMQVFGPQQAADVMAEITAPFADSGVWRASAVPVRVLTASDHSSFWSAGLPGINLSQDPLDYFTNTWHTNLDTYERISAGDLRQAAIVVTSAVYHLAMREQLLPRFGPAEMPRPGATSSLIDGGPVH